MSPLKYLCLCALLLLVTPAHAAELAARDAITGAPVEANIHLAGKGNHHPPSPLNIHGRLHAIDVPDEPLTAVALAPGYRPLHFTLDPSSTSTTLLLDPEKEPAHYRQLETRAKSLPDMAFFQGFVRLDTDGTGIAGAMVMLEGQRTHTDDDGYFEFALPATRHDDLQRTTLRVQAAGIGSHETSGVLLTPGVQRFVVALQQDRLEFTTQQIGALDITSERQMVSGEPEKALPPAATTTPSAALAAQELAPPASIRVGFANAACTQTCCTGACTHACTMPLETYVRRGLHNEWIASWNQQALRAGSIAYRSYGAWRVNNPIRADFDICSNACCQVSGNSTHSLTDAAIARTPGILLGTINGNIAASEYSAENNSWKDPASTLSCTNADLSCGNGHAGSPATGWSCVHDPVSINQSCFGHGRGMSQWGTQRWAIAATPRLWPWIVDHYYNDHGNGTGLRTLEMTSPLQLSPPVSQPTGASPGTTIQIHAEAVNLAGAVHSHLLIGASLYRTGTGYVDDPLNDTPLTLATGTHAISRLFHIPFGTPPGSYDVLLSLYLDVDENGSISSTDLPLALVRANGVLQVGAPAEMLFADGFESD